MTTAIGAWENSAAIRIPGAILELVSLGQRDREDVRVNERCNIKISAASGSHRRVAPAQGVTFDSLFAGYEGGRHDSSRAWPDDDTEGVMDLDARGCRGAAEVIGLLDDATMADALTRLKVALELD